MLYMEVYLLIKTEKKRNSFWNPRCALRREQPPLGGARRRPRGHEHRPLPARLGEHAPHAAVGDAPRAPGEPGLRGRQRAVAARDLVRRGDALRVAAEDRDANLQQLERELEAQKQLQQATQQELEKVKKELFSERVRAKRAERDLDVLSVSAGPAEKCRTTYRTSRRNGHRTSAPRRADRRRRPAAAAPGHLRAAAADGPGHLRAGGAREGV